MTTPQTFPAIKLKYKNNHQLFYQLQRQAHTKVAKALKTGELKKEPCQCGNPKSEAHHRTGYRNPLDIEWLCRPHHVQAHLPRVIFRKVHKRHQLIRTHAAAKKLNVPYHVVLDMIHRKQLPAVRIGGLWKLDRKTIKEIAKKKTKKGGEIMNYTQVANLARATIKELNALIEQVEKKKKGDELTETQQARLGQRLGKIQDRLNKLKDKATIG